MTYVWFQGTHLCAQSVVGGAHLRLIDYAISVHEISLAWPDPGHARLARDRELIGRCHFRIEVISRECATNPLLLKGIVVFLLVWERLHGTGMSWQFNWLCDPMSNCLTLWYPRATLSLWRCITESVCVFVTSGLTSVFAVIVTVHLLLLLSSNKSYMLKPSPHTSWSSPPCGLMTGVVPGLSLSSKVKYAAKITELERAWG